MPTLNLINKRYELLDKLGQGGMGSIFRAKDRLTQQDVALKSVTVPPEELSFASKAGSKTNLRLALAAEFRTLASLRHPHIISVLDYGFDDLRQPYFTMELLESATSLFDAGRDQPLHTRIEMIVQMLQALVYLNRRNILHRDLKPGNVMVVNGRVKVVDFGLSVEVNTPSGRYDTQTTAGTFAYMAPELFAGESITKASDLYAVGVMTYELLAGRHPFNTSNMAVLVAEILTKAPDIASLDLEIGLANVLERLLSKKPEQRYNDAEEVIHDLCAAANLPIPEETAAIRESFLQAARFVGREDELEVLSHSLESALAGHGGAWLVGGESGVGKSRLLDELRTLAQVKGALVLRGQSVREGGVSYQVWRGVLPWLILHTDLRDADAAILKPLVPDIDHLLERPIPTPPPLNPEQAHKELMRVISTLFTHQPVVIVLEDLQWAGSESLSLLDHLSQQAANLPLLLIGNYRDDEQPNLPASLPKCQQIKLPRLSKNEIGRLSVSMLGKAGGNPQVIDLLEQETEGNVFFVVEVVRALAEYAGQLDQIGRGELPAHVLPGGVQEVVQRRLRQVPDHSYALLRLAAVAGRELDLELMEALNTEEDLEVWLANCVNAAVLEVQGDEWRFAHDKLRESLLDELDDQERLEHYTYVAETMESILLDPTDYAATLAHLWDVAGNDDQVRFYSEIAGEHKLTSGAYAEGIKYLQQALDLLLILPDTPERAEDELRLLLLLGPALMNYHGHGHTSVADIYARAAKLGREIQQEHSVVKVLWGVWASSVFQGDYPAADIVVQQMFDTATQTGDSLHQVEAYHVGWTTELWKGNARLMEAYVQHGLDVYDRSEHHLAGIAMQGHDACVCALGLGAVNLWLLGYPDQAVRRAEEAYQMALDLNHPFALGHAMFGHTLVGMFNRDRQHLEAWTERFIETADYHNFAFFIPVAGLTHGWYLARTGRLLPALQQMQDAVEAMHRAKTYVYRPLIISTQMEVHLMAGLIDEGIEVFRQEQEQHPLTGERMMEGEIRRLYGELLLVQGNAAHAEEEFQHALAITRQQEAKSLELRAGMSLARLWGSQGKTQDAHALLSEIYGRFSEGFTTTDLIDAKELLSELA